jgi:hypothetical protein
VRLDETCGGESFAARFALKTDVEVRQRFVHLEVDGVMGRSSRKAPGEL